MVRDVFPAEVVVHGLSDEARMLTGVRVFVTTERCTIWRLDEAKEFVTMEFTDTTTDAKPSRNTLQEGERLSVTREDITITINKGRGCGCGSKLKALAPPINWTRG
jgi:hypothetical protein